jgi:integrase
LSEKTVESLLLSLKESASKRTDTPEGIRMCALLEVLYASGLRVSELVGLPLRSLIIDPKTKLMQNMLMIQGKGGRDRLVPLNEPALEALMQYLAFDIYYTTDKKDVSQYPFYNKENEDEDDIGPDDSVSQFFSDHTGDKKTPPVFPSQTTPPPKRYADAGTVMYSSAPRRVLVKPITLNLENPIQNNLEE